MADGDRPASAQPLWVELYAVGLIALTAVLIAWSAFESSKWGGVMAIRFTGPLTSPDAPRTPFEMSDYQVDARQQAQELEARADRRSAEAREANQRSDDYTITSVFLAMAILLTALAGKVDRPRLRTGLVAGATVLFLGTALVVATFPVEI
jgi:hypothetical protein